MKANAHLRDEELLENTRAYDSHLEACPACRERRHVQQRVRQGMKLLPRETAPSRAALAMLQVAMSGSERRTRIVHTRGFRMLVVACAAAASVWVWWWKERRPHMPFKAPLVEELALDHLHYERKIDAAEVRGDPPIIANWFAAKLGFRPHLGRIEAASVEGAKSCRIAGKWTALVWFERAGHWLSLFTMPEHVVDARGCAAAQGVRVCAVADPRGGARVLVGDLPPEEMLRLVEESLQ